MRRSLLLCGLTLCALVGVANGATIYVDWQADPEGDGTTWNLAFDTLQEALTAAEAGGADIINIAEGTYKPGDGSDRDVSFEIPADTNIVGSYAAGGVSGPDLAHPTVLSGDVDDDDNNGANIDENFHHVVVVSDALNVVLETLIIERGSADGTGQDSRGGGLLIESPDEADGDTVVILEDCIIRDCFADCGAGVAVIDEDEEDDDEASLTLLRTNIVNNRAALAESGDSGGGLFSMDGVVELVLCNLVDNQAHFDGGGLAAQGGEISAELCTIHSNECSVEEGADGGGVYAEGADIRLFNCVLTDNQCHVAPYSRGGAICAINTILKMKSSTVHANIAQLGGALWCQGSGEYSIQNSILYGNVATLEVGIQIALNDAVLTVSYSDVAGDEGGVFDPYNVLLWGAGNIDADPSFVDPQIESLDLRLEVGSDAIDAGDNSATAADILDYNDDANYGEAAPSLDGTYRVSFGCIDMGAYEYQASECPWDTEGAAGTVGFAELTAVLLNYGTCACCKWDTTGSGEGATDEADNVPNGDVGYDDLTDLLLHWGSCSGESFGGGGTIEDEEAFQALVDAYAADGFTEEEIETIAALLDSYGF